MGIVRKSWMCILCTQYNLKQWSIVRQRNIFEWYIRSALLKMKFTNFFLVSTKGISSKDLISLIFCSIHMASSCLSVYPHLNCIWIDSGFTGFHWRPFTVWRYLTYPVVNNIAGTHLLESKQENRSVEERSPWSYRITDNILQCGSVCDRFHKYHT